MYHAALRSRCLRVRQRGEQVSRSLACRCCLMGFPHMVQLDRFCGFVFTVLMMQRSEPPRKPADCNNLITALAWIVTVLIFLPMLHWSGETAWTYQVGCGCPRCISHRERAMTTIIRLTMDQWAFVHGELERIVETDECPRSVRRAAKEIQDTLAQEAETPLQQAAERSEAIGDE